MERRIVTDTSVRAISETNSLALEGIATPFGKYAFLKGFVERVMPGSFAGVLKRAGDGTAQIRCLFNHNPDFVLGGTGNRTLKASEVSSGLSYRCDLDPEIGFHRDIHRLVESRAVTGCSFGFNCDPKDETWDEGFADGLGLDSEEENSLRGIGKKTRIVRRTIHNFTSVSDIGPVTFPAYSATSVNARDDGSLVAIPETCPVEFRSSIITARTEIFDAARYDDVVSRRKNIIFSLF